jgi:hypothetical protein
LHPIAIADQRDPAEEELVAQGQGAG